MEEDKRGRGRPSNTGKFGEPTVVIRVPGSLKPRIQALIAQFPQDEQILPLPSGAIRPKFVGLKRPLSGFKIPAGFPSPADGYREAELSFDELFDMKNPAVFLYWVDGHSLKGVGILDGNLVVVNRSLTPKNGDAVMARVDGKDTFKLWYKDKEGRITLKASNDEIHYPDIPIVEGMEFEFMGVITDTVKMMRKRR